MTNANQSGVTLQSNKPWGRRVGDYLDRLDQTVDEIQDILDRSKVNTTGLEQAQVNDQMIELTAALADLESRLAEREQLLKATDAPVAALTLTEQLRSNDNPVYRKFASRCEMLSEKMQATHEHAIALFVCQHQLADFSTGTLRLLAGAEQQPTYGMEGGRIRKGTDHRCSGSLFDGAG